MKYLPITVLILIAGFFALIFLVCALGEFIHPLGTSGEGWRFLAVSVFFGVLTLGQALFFRKHIYQKEN